jgi:hypothetical protein
MDLRETGWEVVDRIFLGQDRQMADFCKYGNEHSGYIKGVECLDQLSDC